MRTDAYDTKYAAAPALSAKRRNLRVAASVAFLVLLLFAACTRRVPVNDEVLTDEGIKRGVVDELAWNTRIDASTIAVDVDDGAVTLSGTVETSAVRELAVDDTWTVTGVRRVIDRLSVGKPSVPSLELEEAARRARTVLDWSGEIDPAEISVEARDRRIVLYGTVSSLIEKLAAERMVRNVVETYPVDSTIAVVPDESVSDENIAADIAAAFERSANVDVDAVTVIVEDGVVSLTGTVSTPAERAHAETLAFRTPGVIEVENELNVEIDEGG